MNKDSSIYVGLNIAVIVFSLGSACIAGWQSVRLDKLERAMTDMSNKNDTAMKLCEKMGHQWSEWSNFDEYQSPPVQFRTCQICGVREERTWCDVHGHTLGSTWKARDSEGMMVDHQKCLICGKVIVY